MNRISGPGSVQLWDELSSNPDEMPVTEEQLNELDRRFEEYRQDPDRNAASDLRLERI